MALTDTEKKQLKNKFNNYVDTMSNALDVSKTEVKKIISKHPFFSITSSKYVL